MVFDKLYSNELVRSVFDEVPKLQLEENATPDEYQFYLQKVGFYLAHTLMWCKQLDKASEMLTNFSYSTKSDISRADHLIYNIENYLIRLNSVYDRALQLVNVIFHLCIREDSVSHAVIVSNYRVTHQSEVVKRIKALRKYLDEYAQDRHTLIHKHSLLDERLRRIELFYGPAANSHHDKEFQSRLRHVRSRALREYVTEKRTQFTTINQRLSDLLHDLLESLHPEYKAQKSIFKARGF